MNKSFFIVFIFFAYSLTIKAQGVVTITESNKKSAFDLHGNLFYYIDSSNSIGFKDVLNPEFSSKLTQANKTIFNFKANGPTVWFKISIRNKTEDIQQLSLGVNNPLIENISFLSTLDSIVVNTGASQVFEQRPVNNNFFLYKLYLYPGQNTTCWIKVLNQTTPLHIPISLSPQDEVIKSQNKFAYFSGLFYAFSFLFILISGLLFRTERDKTYFFLFLYLLTFLLHKLWSEGVLYQFIWSNSPLFNISFGRFVRFLMVPILMLFANNYLKIARKNKFISKYYKSFLVACILYLASTIFYYNYSVNHTIELVFIALLIIGISSGIYLSRDQKLKFFIQFSIAISLLLIDLILATYLNFDIKGTGITNVSYSTLLITLFFILGANIFLTKFRGSRIEVLNLNKNLEQLVENRTAQLNSQKEELKSQQEELLLQKETLQTQREELRAQKELLELKNSELEKLSLVASKTDNLIYIFDPSGELTWFNKSYGNILGLSYEEYQQAEPKNVIDVSTNKNIRHVLNTCLREKAVVSYESSYSDDQKVTKWYHTTLTPILDDRDNIKQLIAIDTDITRLKQFEKELSQQRTDAENQKNLAIQRKEELEDRQIEITDSIRYAKRIQTAIMPKMKQIARDFQDSFVLFLPKDIVSGDFYWYHRVEDKYFIAAVDCTGHGVPGAFMSIIGNYLLNSIIIHNNISDPAEILKQLNRKIKIALKSDNRTQTNDGMDISIAVINKIDQSLEIASALRPVYLFSQGDFIEIKGDKIPITSNISGTTLTSFKKHSYKFLPGDKFYMFSDGIIDQFGGKNSKKFLTKRFKQLLFEINPLTMREQKEIVKKSFDEWKGKNEQVDDVLVMGIKYTEDLRR